MAVDNPQELARKDASVEDGRARMEEDLADIEGNELQNVVLGILQKGSDEDRNEVVAEDIHA